MYRNRLEFSRWLRASLGPKRSRVFECPGFFGSACSFAHSGGQSVIHRRNALSVGLTPPPGLWASVRPAMLPKKRTGRIADLNIYPRCEPKNSSSSGESSEDFAAAYFSKGSWLSERKVSPHLNKDKITPACCRKPVRMSAAARASAVLSLPAIP